MHGCGCEGPNPGRGAATRLLLVKCVTGWPVSWHAEVLRNTTQRKGRLADANITLLVAPPDFFLAHVRTRVGRIDHLAAADIYTDVVQI